MTHTDANILYALVDPRQEAHARCKAALQYLPKPMLTTCFCLTEAMYFAYKTGGWTRQQMIWRLIEDGLLQVAHLSDAEMKRMCVLMEKYRDTPMDLADASLVAIAESRNNPQIFTMDTDFYVYQMNDNQPFLLIP